MQNFLRRVKYYRNKSGLPELKYVAVTEIGKKTARLHHHIVMSGGVDINTLAEIWGRGYTTAKPLQFNEQGIVGIAKYLIKEPILNKRWSASRNLKKPKEDSRDGKLPQYKVKEWSNSLFDNRTEIENIYTDYALADIKGYHNKDNGGYYVTVFLYHKNFLKQTKRRGCYAPKRN